VLEEEDSQTAEHLYDIYRDEGVIAPALMPAEVTNAVWRRVARGFLTPLQGEEALERFLGFEVSLSTDPRVHQIAFNLAWRFQRPAVYDMYYVAVAQLAGCELCTADKNLLNALGGSLAFVRPLCSFQA
jgi:predicted nucleic acid-binding protein